VVEVDDDPVVPEPAPEFFPRNDLARLLQKQRENLERLLLQPDPDTRPPCIAGSWLEEETVPPGSALADRSPPDDLRIYLLLNTRISRC
jgi:hypothetical protein